MGEAYRVWPCVGSSLRVSPHQISRSDLVSRISLYVEPCSAWTCQATAVPYAMSVAADRFRQDGCCCERRLVTDGDAASASIGCCCGDESVTRNVADLVVGGRCLSISTFRGIAQPGRAPALGAGSREFESRCPDQQIQILRPKSLASRHSLTLRRRTVFGRLSSIADPKSV